MVILHKNISLYLFSTVLNEYKSKMNCKTETYFLLSSTHKTVTFSMVGCIRICDGPRADYMWPWSTKRCRNLGSLRAGTRHQGETLRYGNSFPEVLLAHASLDDWPIVAKHANTDELKRQYKCDARNNYVRIWYWTALSSAGEQRAWRPPRCLVPGLREPRLRQ